MSTIQLNPEVRELRFVGLFAGIGGFELGFRQAAFKPTLLCEIDANAQEVLRAHFPGVHIHSDIRDLKRLPECDVLCAGFPCQDLSAAGRTAGIEGSQSGLIHEVFRLLRVSAAPEWIVFENVPFMLQLERGKAIRLITATLGKMGFNWAYRVVDARTFGIPQRRRRVLLVASQSGDPRKVLFADEAPSEDPVTRGACGFYWTEGNTGLGWAQNAIPTLKGGSGLGIPSPPGIWLKGKGVFAPSIVDAERLQGFPAHWTASVPVERARFRWKLVGNALAVPMAGWLAGRVREPGTYDHKNDIKFAADSGGWPYAAWGEKGLVYRSSVSEWPLRRKWIPLLQFLEHKMTPLSSNAAAGFLKRARASRLKFHEGFLDDVAEHVEGMRSATHARKKTREAHSLVASGQ